MTYKLNSKGFTLVEVVVVGLLMSILALGAFSLFNMYLNATRESAAYLKLQRQGEALVDEITKEVRNGAFVLGVGEDAEDYLVVLHDNDFIGIPVNYFFISDDKGDLLHEFSIIDVNTMIVKGVNVPVKNTGKLQKNGVDFTIDGSPIYVDITPVPVVGNAVGTPKPFELWFDRKQVVVNMRLKIKTGNKSSDENKNEDEFFLTIQEGAFRCRNDWQ